MHEALSCMVCTCSDRMSLTAIDSKLLPCVACSRLAKKGESVTAAFLYARAAYDEGSQHTCVYRLHSTSERKQPSAPAAAAVPSEAAASSRLHFFICHNQHTGNDQAGRLRAELQLRGCECWFCDDMVSEEPSSAERSNLEHSLRQGVQQCEALVLMLTNNVLTRPWVHFELREAIKARKPVLMLQDPLNTDAGFLCTVRETAPADLQPLFAQSHLDTCCMLFQRRGFEVEAMVQWLVSKMHEPLPEAIFTAWDSIANPRPEAPAADSEDHSPRQETLEQWLVRVGLEKRKEGILGLLYDLDVEKPSDIRDLVADDVQTIAATLAGVSKTRWHSAVASIQ